MPKFRVELVTRRLDELVVEADDVDEAVHVAFYNYDVDEGKIDHRVHERENIDESYDTVLTRATVLYD